MAFQASATTSMASFLLLFFFLLPSCSPASSPPPPPAPLQSFLQCLQNHSVPSSLIFTQQSSGYTTLLLSSVQNTRFVLPGAGDTKPAAIVKPASASHAQAAVVCGRQKGLRLRVRSGGHDYEGMSYVSTFSGSAGQFVVLDLSGLRTITFDATTGTALVQSGATIGELYYAIGKTLGSATLAFPAGTCPTIGVGGHFSGGGIGALVRMYGTSADNVVDAMVVDANGRLLNRTSMGEDLFWAIRGGGAASFGVVVAFRIKLVAVPATVTGFNVIRNLNVGDTALISKWQSAAPAMGGEFFIRVIAQAIVDGSGSVKIQVMFNSLYFGPRVKLLAAIATSFPELGLKSSDCTEMSWLQSTLFYAGLSGQPPEKLLDRSTPASSKNASFKGKSDFVTRPINATGWQSIWGFLAGAVRVEPLILILEPMGGAMSSIPSTAIAFPHRQGNLFEIQYIMNWAKTDAATTQGHLAWMKKMYGFMAPFVSSNPRAAYYNYKDIDLGSNGGGSSSFSAAAASWGSSYFKGNLRRLAAVKAAVDPSDFFRNEQSIPPLAASAGGK